MERKPYPSDLTDEQWALLEPLLPDAKPGGRPRDVDLREVLNDIVYLVKGGILWRYMPHDLPPWGTVHFVYRQWRLDGTWKLIEERLRTRVQHTDDRHKNPSAAVIDTQSVKTAEGGEERGDDAGKRVAGRKQHIIVDTIGLLIAVVVHSASVQDRDGIKLVLERIKERVPRLEADRGGWFVRGRGRLGLVVWPLDAGPGEETRGPQGVPCAAPPLGDGADIRLAESVPAAEQGLRAADRIE
jgi:putative transposase